MQITKEQKQMKSKKEEPWPKLKALPYVAERAGIDYQRLRRWHLGKQNLDLGELVQLRAALARAERSAEVLVQRAENEILNITEGKR